MGRETKIGLLVGMCFIICFAIILSQRGDIGVDPGQAGFEIATIVRQTPLPSPVATRRQAQAPPAPHPQPAPDTQVATDVVQRTLPVTPDAPSGADRDPAPTSVDPLERFTTRGAPLEGPVSEPPSLVDLRGPHQRQEIVAAREEKNARAPLLVDHPRWTPADEADEPDWGPITVALQAQTQARPSARGQSIQPDRPDGRSASDGSAPEAGLEVLPPPVFATHVVKPGDNLTRIAQQYYGLTDRSTIEAIFEANRETMSHPDQVVVGRTLLLPEIGGRSASTQEEEAAPPTRAGEPADDPVRGSDHDAPAIHIVKPGDTLTRIAKAHYDSAGREVISAVFEANRDLMSSPDQVVVGWKLKLPVIEGLLAAGRDGGSAATTAPEPAGADRRDSREVRQAAVEPRPSEDRDGEGIDWKWYQLQEGDVYSTVAAEQLGTSKRWPELARLNEDIFPDASRIRYGVNIRVPVDRGRKATIRAVNGGA